MRSHPIPAAVIAMSIVGALGCKKEGPPGPDASPNVEATLSAAELCDAVYDAPLRHLATRCTADDKGRQQYRYLVGLSTEARTQCTARLGALASRGAMRLRADAARRCGQLLESTSWKETLAIPDVTRFPECRGLIAGTQAQGQACESTLECTRDLVCSRAPGAPAGVCGAPLPGGAPCERVLLEALGDQRSCGPDAACSNRTSNQFLSSALGAHTSELGAHASALGAHTSELDPPTARQQALREAAEFGMIGLLNSGAAPPATRGDPPAPWGQGIDALDGPKGEGIGLGSIGGISGFGASGFGSGQGRIGGKRSQKSPTVRLGATTVSGRLPPEVIQRIVRQNFGRFRLCYENGLRNNPALSGRVTVRFAIGRDGSVGSVSSGGSDLPDSGVVACVTRAFYGLSFPQPEGGIVTVTYPILFAPPEGAAASSAASASPEAGAPVEASTDSDAGSDVGSQAMPAGIGALESSPPLGMLNARESGTCTSLAKAGEPCERGEVCVDGLVCRMGRCSSDPRGVAGVACERGEDCQPDLYCGRAPDPSAAQNRGVCAARKPGGEACTSSVQCDGVCMSGKCAAFCGSR